MRIMLTFLWFPKWSALLFIFFSADKQRQMNYKAVRASKLTRSMLGNSRATVMSLSLLWLWTLTEMRIWDLQQRAPSQIQVLVVIGSVEVAGEQAWSPGKAALAEGTEWVLLVRWPVHSQRWEVWLLLFQKALCGLPATVGWKRRKGTQKRKLPVTAAIN